MHIIQTKSAPNPDDMQNTGGDIMKKFAAVVKYERDDDIHPSIHHDNNCWSFMDMEVMKAQKIFQEPKARPSG